MKKFVGLFTLLVVVTISAQENEMDVPYASIPDAPTEYTAFTVTSRMIDGLGFRFYWATEGLTEANLLYRVNEDGRTISETIEHVYNLSMIILNSSKKLPTDFTVDLVKPSTSEMRAVILKNLKEASELIKASTDLSEHSIVFKNKKGTRELPFWNQINGPIEDAVWHSGQIVLMRRAAGNPFNSKASVLTGTVRD